MDRCAACYNDCMKRKGSRVALATLLLCAMLCFMNMATKRFLAVSRYTIASAKLTSPVRICVVTDLHNSRFGPRQQGLYEAAAAESPDLIVLVGDIFDVHENERNAHDALRVLAANFPCYYVTGNHERFSRREQQIKEAVRSYGITVLQGAAAAVSVNGQTVLLCGLDDLRGGSAAMLEQLETLSGQLGHKTYSVLLCHRPERVATILPYGFDLMLSGHTHGGQWRVPFAENGLFAPGQGWFPQYAGGCFSFGGQALIVSRGLSQKPYLLPRFGNPPELVAVTLSPE